MKTVYKTLATLALLGIGAGCYSTKTKELELKVVQLEKQKQEYEATREKLVKALDHSIAKFELIPLELDINYNQEKNEGTFFVQFKKGWLHQIGPSRYSVDDLRPESPRYGMKVSIPSQSVPSHIAGRKSKTLVKHIDINGDDKEDIAIYDGEHLDFFIAGEDKKEYTIYRIF